MEKPMDPEVGDVFIIPKRDKKCKNKNKKFVVKSFSKYSTTVYYDDNRTNDNCDCGICKPWKVQYSILLKTKSFSEHKEREIQKQLIRVVERKLERQRELALRLILGKLDE